MVSGRIIILSLGAVAGQPRSTRWFSRGKNLPRRCFPPNRLCGQTHRYVQLSPSILLIISATLEGRQTDSYCRRNCNDGTFLLAHKRSGSSLTGCVNETVETGSSSLVGASLVTLRRLPQRIIRWRELWMGGSSYWTGKNLPAIRSTRGLTTQVQQKWIQLKSFRTSVNRA